MRLLNFRTLTREAVLLRVTRRLVTPVARDTSLSRDPNMPSSCDRKAGIDPFATSVQSKTVPSSLTGNVNLFSKLPSATYTTPHPEASLAASTASGCFQS